MKRYMVRSGRKIHLSQWDPEDTSEFNGKKKEAEDELLELNKKIDQLQELLYAEHKHQILFVLQAMDTGGKDGTIRKVFEGVNPQAVKVTSFKKPSDEELAHDYLWRIHQHVPRKGEIMIFNRSHYEDVLVVRVHKLVPAPVIKKRYAQINDFERMLSEEGTTILKFYLHINEKEQKERLEERLKDPDKHWKFAPSDLSERKLWSEYMKAYEDTLSNTSTAWAPWYIIPSNKKWYRNLIIARILAKTMKDLDMKVPRGPDGIDKIVVS